MLPHEAQAAMAKVLFFVFAILMLSIGKLKANELAIPKTTTNSQFSSLN
ncbi:hypothetical protein N9O57_00780 [bacterium]|nr:hypothetical protein [bacterium]